MKIQHNINCTMEDNSIYSTSIKTMAPQRDIESFYVGTSITHNNIHQKVVSIEILPFEIAETPDDIQKFIDDAEYDHYLTQNC